jgi:hypothetical protein
LAAHNGKRMKAVPIGRPSPPTLREHGGTSAADATIAPTGPLAALAAECRGAATEAEPGESPLRLLRTGGKMMEPRFPVNLPHHGDAPVSDVLCHAARIRHCAKREPLDAGDVPRPLTGRRRPARHLGVLVLGEAASQRVGSSSIVGIMPVAGQAGFLGGRAAAQRPRFRWGDRPRRPRCRHGAEGPVASGASIKPGETGERSRSAAAWNGSASPAVATPSL